MFIMAATVSSCALIRVGPNMTPRFETVMRFCWLCNDTLKIKNISIQSKFSVVRKCSFLSTCVRKTEAIYAARGQFPCQTCLFLMGVSRNYINKEESYLQDKQEITAQQQITARYWSHCCLVERDLCPFPAVLWHLLLNRPPHFLFSLGAKQREVANA